MELFLWGGKPALRSILSYLLCQRERGATGKERRQPDSSRCILHSGLPWQAIGAILSDVKQRAR